MYCIHLWCVLLQNAHSAICSGVGFFCPVGLSVPSFHPMPAGMLPQYVRGVMFDAYRICSRVVHRSQCYPGWMTDHLPTRADECRLSARLRSRLVKDAPPAQGWIIARLDSLCDVPG